jgi:alanyl-tRNA synthetase
VAQDQLCDHVHEVGHQQELRVVLDRSPFYGESGGQTGDTGEIVGPRFRFHVTDTQRDGSLILHRGHLVEGELRTGVTVTARVDTARRQGIRRAHSATHILHYALRKNLGQHAQQQGSKVDDDWLRFDFTNLSPVSAEQLALIERDALERIAAREPVVASVLPLAEARQAGAMMLFGEKYPDPVRMIAMGEFSRELCGGTHLTNTAEVGPLEVLSEEGVSAGTRRIVALTGEKARAHAAQTRAALAEAAHTLGVALLQTPAAVHTLAQTVRDLKKQLSSGTRSSPEETRARQPAAAPTEPSYAEIKTALRDAARTLNTAPFEVPARVTALQQEVAELQQQLARLTQSGAVSAESLFERAETVGATKLIVADVPGANPNLMRHLIDQLRKKATSTAVLFATSEGPSRVTLVAGVSRDLVARGISAGQWVKEVAPVVGGGGGGKPDMAQAGGKLPEKLPEAVDAAKQTMRKLLSEPAAGD